MSNELESDRAMVMNLESFSRRRKRILGTLREITLRAKRWIGTEGALERC